MEAEALSYVGNLWQAEAGFKFFNLFSGLNFIVFLIVIWVLGILV
jgi:hypothetical protein